MTSVIKATFQDIPAVRSIAHAAWYLAYEGILSEKQIVYMLEMMYSVESLTKQIEINKHLFFLAQEKNQALGFVSIELHYQNQSVTKIHKIYILPTAQRKGVGRMLMQKAEEVARKHQNTKLQLNVNRHNKASNFYHKLGFQAIHTEDIDIGNGYLMEDYVLEKKLY